MQFFGDMQLIRELYAPNIAMLPISDFYTMGPKGATLSAGLLVSGKREKTRVHTLNCRWDTKRIIRWTQTARNMRNVLVFLAHYLLLVVL